ncbi:MAG: hypothetical protein ABS69_07905 [Nitrosomonadales bacterium SCN 54-20]|nr:MAG: hypothetical protein ABS69_07905 [Nitrosomonadales bacterium SCN 54-20]
MGSVSPKYLFWLKEQGWHRKCLKRAQADHLLERQELEVTGEYLRERCSAEINSVYFPATRFAHDVSVCAGRLREFLQLVPGSSTIHCGLECEPLTPPIFRQELQISMGRRYEGNGLQIYHCFFGI